MSRQQRRAAERSTAKQESRRQQFDRIHGQVLAGKTIRDLWLTYGGEMLTPHGIKLDDPAVVDTLEAAFYAGVAAMFELHMRVSTDDVSEEVGVEMLSRLHEELESYTQRRRGRSTQ